jgi:hypothetical protein|nr:MAG TPA: Protein of unknown function (DUF2718) [Caudoviricetes sp.]
MAWMLFAIGVTFAIVGVTTVKIFATIFDTDNFWVARLCNVICYALIGYPGAYLTFTHLSGVGL